MEDDLADAARFLTRAAEHLTSNPQTTSNSVPDGTQAVATTVASGSVPRAEGKLRSLFPHHFRPLQNSMINH